MFARFSKTPSFLLLVTLIAFALSSALHAQTFQTVPALAFTEAFA